MISRRLRLGLSVLALLVPITPLQAQPAAPLDERLFAAYVLDEMYVHTLPLPEASGGLRPPAYVQFSAFVAQRRVIFDTLRRYYEKRKLDPTVFDLYRDFEREIGLWKDFNDQVTASVQAYDRAMARGLLAASQRAWNTGLAYGLQAFFGGGSGDEALLTGWLRAAQAAAIEREKLSRLQLDAYNQLQKAFEEAGKKYGPRIEEVRKRNYQAFRTAVDDLRSKHDWKDAEFAHDRKLRAGATNPEPSRNPFRIAAAALAVLRDKEASRENLLKQAGECQRASDMVPAGKVYNYFRTIFLGLAGVLANQAALKDLGAAGFASAVKNPAKAGAVALKIWQRYVVYEGSVNDEVVHKFLQACGCAGKPRAALEVMRNRAFQLDRFRRLVPNPSFSRDPVFWYDCARVASLMGEAPAAAECLRLAVNLGYRDFEAAKVDPDLRNVRESPATSRQFQAVIR
jgi:hypothetical protein